METVLVGTWTSVFGPAATILLLATTTTQPSWRLASTASKTRAGTRRTSLSDDESVRGSAAFPVTKYDGDRLARARVARTIQRRKASHWQEQHALIRLKGLLLAALLSSAADAPHPALRDSTAGVDQFGP